MPTSLIATPVEAHSPRHSELPETSEASGGLWRAMEGQVQAFEASSGLQCEWSMDIAPGLLPPRGPMASTVYCMFREMLLNVVRHAQAQHVVIRVRADDSDISILVKDNGRGAPPSAFEARKATGVAGIREQAQQLGGWLDVHSQIGAGTTLILTLPQHPYPPTNQTTGFQPGQRL